MQEQRCDGRSDFPSGAPALDENGERERVAKTNEPSMSRRRVSGAELGCSGLPGYVLPADGRRSTRAFCDDSTHPFRER